MKLKIVIQENVVVTLYWTEHKVQLPVSDKNPSSKTEHREGQNTHKIDERVNYFELNYHHSVVKPYHFYSSKEVRLTPNWI